MRIVAVALAVLVAGILAVALIRPFGTATVWFSSNGTGYMCFLDYSNPATRGPLCLDDLNNNATISLGNYTIVFFATRMPQGAAFKGFLTTGSLSVGNWTDYDQSFSYQAPLTVNGDGTILPSWSIPSVAVPEFSAVSPMIGAAIFIIAGLKKKVARKR